MSFSRLHAVALSLQEGIGPQRLRNLLAHCDSLEAVFTETDRSLLTVSGMNPALVKSLKSPDLLRRAEEELAFIEKHKIDIHYFLEDDYPYRLRECYDSPTLLYSLGEMNLNANRIISVVGTRDASGYGQTVTEKLVSELVAQDVVVISGLAYGIDVAAHKAAIKAGGSTIGVVAHGLDKMYPSSHRSIAKQMLDKGGLLTQYPSNTIADAVRFPARNRIVAGISDATLVVESKKSGGAMITAHMAHGYERQVFAVPGKIDAPLSEGCNLLIKNHVASLIDSTEEILNHLGWNSLAVNIPSVKDRSGLSNEALTILGLLDGKNEMHVDNIGLKSGLQLSTLSKTLLDLELYGFILSKAGKMYTIKD